MFVHLVGFRWALPGTIKLADFATHWLEGCGKPLSRSGYDRVYFAAVEGSLLQGVFMTVKDHKKATTIDVKSHKIRVEQFKDGNRPVDFNFFVVNTATGKGLFSYYHNSCGVNTFTQIVRRSYNEYRDGLIKTEIDALGSAPTRKAEAAVRKKYSGVMSGSTMVRPEELPDLLARLKRIKVFHFDASTLVADNATFRPLAGQAKNRTVRFAFPVTADLRSLRANLVNLVTGLSLRKGKIEGESEDGLREIVQLVNTPDSFGHHEFDSVVQDGMIAYDAISESPFLGMMRKVMTDNSIHFDSMS